MLRMMKIGNAENQQKDVAIMKRIMSGNLGSKLVTLISVLLLCTLNLVLASSKACSAPLAYIAIYDDGKVAVLDTATDTIINTITVGTKPYSVAITPDQKYAYVPNNGDSTVSVIELATSTVIKTIHGTGTKPTMIAITPDGKTAYVTNNGDSYMSIIDTATNTITGSVNTGFQPFAVAITPDGTRAYVANQGVSSVSVIDLATKTVTLNIGVGNNPSGVFISADGTQAYICSPSDGTVAIIDLASNIVTSTLNLGGRPFGMVFSPDGNLVYIANFTSQNIAVVDTATNAVLTLIPDTGNLVSLLAMTPDGSKIYATHEYSNSVAVVDTTTNTIISVLPSGNHPMGLAIPQGLPIAHLARFSVTPNVLSGGKTGSAKVSIAAPFTSNTTIALTSSNPAVTLPASVTILAGQTFTTFNVSTATVLTDISVILSVNLNGVTKQSALTVTAKKLSSLSLSSSKVIGGKSPIGTVRISGPAPSGGFIVTLSSSAASAATVPASVTIPEGAVSASFTITTTPVSSAANASISASFGDTDKSSVLTIIPPALSSLTIKFTSLMGGAGDIGTVKLTGIAPDGGVDIVLNSSAPEIVGVPSGVNVPVGALSTTFPITTVPVGSDITVGIHAILDGINKASNLKVKAPVLSSLTISPTSVKGGVQNSTGTITLTGNAPEGDLIVSLSSSDISAAMVPSTITVLAGTKTAAFTITSVAVTIQKKPVITATTGVVNRTATLTVHP